MLLQIPPLPPLARPRGRGSRRKTSSWIEDEEIEEAFDDVPADDQSGVLGPAQDIEDSEQPNACSPATGYKTEWSEYKAEVDEIKAYPSAAVVLTERTAVAAKEAVVQIKTLLTVNLTLLARFTHFEANLCTRLKVPPAAGHEDFVQMLVKDVTDAAAGDKDNGGGRGSAEGSA
ncbi:hypothetical protein EKO04_011556 [Ascochyta lentis]|uniref:Uncharacterized protein n=1 Tax=Ascochyta lentis TaxID=205686 RepID=A0A8H7ITG7_9PLEO|nr:hypothetical protein EKO04_011556 [Ascochyta lentis]